MIYSNIEIQTHKNFHSALKYNAYRKKRLLTQRRNNRLRTFGFIISILIAAVLVLAILSPALKSEASTTYQIQKVYQSVKVEHNMTLEGLAKQYNTEDQLTNKDFIKEIKKINHLDSDSIHTASYVVVPIYKQIKSNY